jgi:hypothetical protein
MNWDMIAFWAFLTVVVIGTAWISHLGRRESERTIRDAIDKGVAVDGDLIGKLRRASSLTWFQRLIGWGIVTIFLSLGIALFGLLLPEPESLRPMLGIAALFAFIGLGLVACGFWLGKSGES